MAPTTDNRQLTTGSSFAQRWHDIRTGFARPFWVANLSELFERLSYYAAFASLARYLHETLKFPIEQAGTLTGFFGGLVWFLAVFGGAVADRMGFRRALSVAYLILSCAYFLLGSLGASWMAPLRDSVPLIALATFVLALPALGIALVSRRLSARPPAPRRRMSAPSATPSTTRWSTSGALPAPMLLRSYTSACRCRTSSAWRRLASF